jgi:ergothioneine biosynthesis protein EgtB
MPAKLHNPAETSLARHYLAVRRQTETLTAPLSAEDCNLQSMPDASPAKWHLAHTTWFFETFLLAPHLPGYRPLNEDFRFLFNSYYNAVGDRPLRAMRAVLSRPSLEVVRAYRRHVDEAMLRLLDGNDERVAELATLGLHHEQQHQELIVTDVKHGLWSNPLRPVFQPEARFPGAGSGAAPMRWRAFEEGLRDIGFAGGGFCFDNELPRHPEFVAAFEIASRLVTVAEYLEFMLDGGYAQPRLWLSAGWDTVQAQGWKGPLYWEAREGQWWHYTVLGMRPVSADLHTPVTHISYFEADAFARWAGARLATEAEWETATAERPPEGNLLESGNFHPVAASHGQDQMFGDAWEWTHSPYTGYPGYRPAEGALGEYNGKFMCDQWVLRGGSCATPRSHIRASYRNFFPAGARWQYTGIRLARSPQRAGS